MTVIRNNSISGINSITAQSGALNFYDSTGNTLAISADVTGGVTVATGATISGSTNTITASTNGSERLRIASDGDVFIGNSNLGTNVGSFSKLEVTGTLDNTYPQYSFPLMVNDDAAYNSSGGPGGGIGFAFKQTSGGAWAQAGGIRGVKENTTDGNYASALIFYTRPNGSGVTEAARFNSSGNLAFPSGNGIDFSATSDTGGMTSELLDDYEEGTFTPTVTGSTTAGTTTFTNRSGYYTKIGRQVTIIFNVHYTAATGTGFIQLGGFPFTVGGDVSIDGASAALEAAAYNWSGGTYLVVYAGRNTTFANIFGEADDADRTAGTINNEDAVLRFTMTYFI